MKNGVDLKGLSPRKVASGRLSLTADNHSKVALKGVNRVRPYRAFKPTVFTLSDSLDCHLFNVIFRRSGNANVTSAP